MKIFCVAVIISMLWSFVLSKEQGFWVTTLHRFQDIGFSIAEAPDSGYVILGKTDSFSISGTILTKLSENGNHEWTKLMQNSGQGIEGSVITTDDGGIMVTGAIRESTSWDVLVAKFDALGGVEWAKVLVGGTLLNENDVGFDIIQSSTGEYVLVGKTQSFDASFNREILAIKLFENGDFDWAKIYKGARQEWARAVVETQDRGYVMTGGTSTWGTSAADNEIFVLKVDTNGTIVWSYVFADAGAVLDECNGIIETTSGEIVVTGEVYSFAAGNSDLFVAKLDSSGGIIWQKTLGTGSSYDRGHDVIETQDGDFLIIGSGWDAMNEAVVTKLDTDGNVIWIKLIGKEDQDRAYAGILDSSGNIVMVGSIREVPQSGIEHVLVAKFDSNDSCGDRHLTEFSTVDSGLLEIDITGSLVEQDVLSTFSSRSYSLSAGSFVDANDVKYFYPNLQFRNWGWEWYSNPIDDMDADDSSLVISGSTTKCFLGSSAEALIVTKFAVDGSMDWARHVELDDGAFNCWFKGKSIQTHANGDVLVTGEVFFDFSYEFLFTCKFSTDGEMIFFTRMDFSSSNYRIREPKLAILDTSSFSYIATTLYDNTENFIFISKIDSSGNHIWNTVLGTTNNQGHANGIVALPDESVVVVGNVEIFGTNNGVVIKMFPNGTTAWVKSVNGTSILKSVCRTSSDGNIVVAGESSLNEIYIAKIEPSTGEIMWCIKYEQQPQNLMLDTLIETRNKDLVVSINVAVANTIIVARLDGDGNSMWQKEGSVLGDASKGIRELADGKFALVGDAFVVTIMTADGDHSNFSNTILDATTLICSVTNLILDENSRIITTVDLSNDLLIHDFTGGIPIQDYVCRSINGSNDTFAETETDTEREDTENETENDTSNGETALDTDKTQFDTSFDTFSDTSTSLVDTLSDSSDETTTNPMLSFLSNYWFVLPLVIALIIITCISLIFLVIVLVFVCIRQKEKKKWDKIGGDIILSEVEAENAVDFCAKFRISKKLFEIQYDDIELIREISKGGSSSTIFEGNWKDKRVVFKEKELHIISSISHPNIVSFFGASLKQPRIGIVQEFLANGDIMTYTLKNNPDMKEKMRILIEICCGMEYLHERSIIHRDIKCDNILLSESNTVKIIDFGVSKLDFDKNAKKTMRIGTSITTFKILEDEAHPYPKELVVGIESRVALDENVRPVFRKIGDSAIQKLVRRCWKHSPNDRPESFTKVKLELKKILGDT